MMISGRTVVTAFGLFLTLLFPVQSMAQGGKNTLRISGGSVTATGSSFHDWYCEAEPALTLVNNGKAPPVDGFLNGIPDLSMNIAVTALNCDDDSKDSVSKLEKNLQVALKAKDNPNIVFKMVEYVLSGSGTAAVTGNLTIAGVTKEVNFSVNLTEHVNGTNLQAKGETVVLMSDYGIKPIRALLGTVSTTDEVKIEFKVLLTPPKPEPVG